MILAPDGTNLAGLLMFNTDTTPGEAFDGIFYFTGRGLNWDPYGHHPGDASDANASLPCTPDANGYNTVSPHCDQLLRVVPGPQQASRSCSLRRCCRRRPGDTA